MSKIPHISPHLGDASSGINLYIVRHKGSTQRPRTQKALVHLGGDHDPGHRQRMRCSGFVQTKESLWETGHDRRRRHGPRADLQ